MKGTPAALLAGGHSSAGIRLLPGPGRVQGPRADRPALGASVAHEANTEDLLYGGYTGAAAPAAPSATWLWTGSWAAG